MSSYTIGAAIGFMVWSLAMVLSLFIFNPWERPSLKESAGLFLGILAFTVPVSALLAGLASVP